MGEILEFTPPSTFREGGSECACGKWLLPKGAKGNYQLKDEGVKKLSELRRKLFEEVLEQVEVTVEMSCPICGVEYMLTC